MYTDDQIDNGKLTSRLHKTCCCPCYIPCNMLWLPCRNAVSGKKRRYQKGGFDLDLTYITPRIIVHGFPASGLEHVYRNPRLEIRRFMDTYHKDKYKMFNFCCEYGRSYDPAEFHNRVERYPFKDHNTPPLETMVAFATSAKAWLDEDPEHVVNMHCKAGKGRAGLMSCVMLIRSGAAQSAVEALDIYDRERVTNYRGLTVTSQRKFVFFYEALWRQCWGVEGDIGKIPASEDETYTIPVQPTRVVHGVELLNAPKGLYKHLQVKVFSVGSFGATLLYDSGKKNPISEDSMVIPCDPALCSIQANFKVQIFHNTKKTLLSTKRKNEKVFELLHNTFFMNAEADSVEFESSQLDIKKRVKAILGSRVALRLRFSPIVGADGVLIALESPVDLETGATLTDGSSGALLGAGERTSGGARAAGGNERAAPLSSGDGYEMVSVVVSDD